MINVAGVRLSSFEEPVRVALTQYSEKTDGRVVFDTETAPRLEPAPDDKAYSGRSVSAVKHLGETVGNLHVLVFAPGDGTGDESLFKLTDSMLGAFYPLNKRVVPRSKAAFHSEAHLTIATQMLNEKDADPTMYAGHLELVGLKYGRLRMMGILGQDRYDFVQAVSHEGTADPTVTYTTGYRESDGERFGDPHAVFNPDLHHVQVCGFVAVANEFADRHAAMLTSLGAKEPLLRF